MIKHECKYKRVRIMEAPPMRMHDENEPIYGDGSGHYWYEGEEWIEKDILVCECGKLRAHERIS